MINLLPNQTIQLTPLAEAADTGWTISGQLATHAPCNAGTMKSVDDDGLEIGKTYVVSYVVSGFISGTVNVNLGTNSGTSRTANGLYTENIECTGTTPFISFFSDGALSISQLSFYELVDNVDNSVTLAFYDGNGNDKRWVSTYSYSPEMMIKFVNSFFSIKAGALWLHNANPIRNNFYGVQYNSQIQFYDSLNPTMVKLFYSMRVQANTPWACPNNGDISLLPVIGRQNGMSSRLKKGNFRNYQGSFFADFMRNYLDTRFDDPEVALFQGEPLRGRVMEINISNSDTTEAILLEVDIKSAPSSFTY